MKYTDEFLISELKRYYEEFGEVPKRDNFDKNSNYPSPAPYRNYFGSWSNALKEAGFKTKKLSNEFLISELHRYNEEFGEIPTKDKIIANSEYPVATPFQRAFGSWNNALIAAGFSLNQYQDHWQTGDEVCSICGGDKGKKNWNYDEKLNKICMNCNTKLYYKKHKNPLYKCGKLNYKSMSAKGLIGELIVQKVLNIEINENLNDKWGNSYDLYDKKYGKIDVKTSTKINGTKNKMWNIGLINSKKDIIYQKCDTIIILCKSTNEKIIEKVWIIPSYAEILQDK